MALIESYRGRRHSRQGSARFLDRKIIALDGADIDHGGSGRPRLFGARTVYRTAITYRLVRSGLAPATARRLASNFCDEAQPGRQPGALFSSGKTLLVASPDGGGRIVNLPPEAFVDDVLNDEVTIVVDVGRIIAGVNRRLGLVPPDDRDVDGILREFCNQSDLKVNHDANF
jgi:hypothetical protein